MSRKTVDVEQVLKECNQVLKESTCSPDVRQGVRNVLENILFASGNYHGFRFLGKGEVPVNQLPGINADANDVILDYQARFDNTDATRVQYF